MSGLIQWVAGQVFRTQHEMSIIPWMILYKKWHANYEQYKTCKNENLQKHAILKGFKENGLQIRIQCNFSHNIYLRVSFSSAPECVELDCWNQAFSATPSALLEG